MFMVVPGEKASCPCSRIVNGGEAVRIIGAIFHGFELRLTEGIIVGGVRTAVTFGDAQIDQQLAQRLALHRAAVVGVERKLLRLDALFANSFSDQLACQITVFDLSDHPTDDRAAENIQHGVERVFLQLL